MRISERVGQHGHLYERGVVQCHVRVVGVVQGFVAVYRSVGRREPKASQNGHACAGAAHHGVTLCQCLIDGVVQRRSLPQRVVIRLVPSGKPNAFRAVDQRQHVRVGGGVGVLADNGGDAMDVHPQLTVHVAVVSVRTRGTQHHDVASTRAFEKPCHGVVVFRRTAHQAHPTLALKVSVDVGPGVVQGKPLRAQIVAPQDHPHQRPAPRKTAFHGP